MTGGGGGGLSFQVPSSKRRRRNSAWLSERDPVFGPNSQLGGGHLKIQPWDAKKKQMKKKTAKLLSRRLCSAYTVLACSIPYTCGQPAPYIFAPDERQKRRRPEPQENLIECIVERSYPTALSAQLSVRSCIAERPRETLERQVNKIRPLPPSLYSFRISQIYVLVLLASLEGRRVRKHREIVSIWTISTRQS